MEGFDISRFIMTMLALALSITVHEWAHAISADKLGDDTPRLQGRVTLWPGAHLDPVGSVMMIISSIVGFGIGWGRPVLTNPNNYRINRRTGDSLVALAGPFSNLVLAALFALLLRFDVFPPSEDGAFWFVWTNIIVLVNIALCLFNLIPVYPLDGSHLLANSLPPHLAEGYLRFSQQFGIFIFIALIMSGATRYIIGPPAENLFRLLVGG